ncbi:MAG: VOC family protein [Sphingomonadales bacterium]
MFKFFVFIFFLFSLGSCGEIKEEGKLSSHNIDAMSEFGTTASNVFFYYKDLEGATKFYRETMGFRVAADYGFAKVMQVANKSFITLVDASKGMHGADDPKTTAIALITDQLDGWWNYISSAGVEMRTSVYKKIEGRPHHGFVAVDPEGYLLEFETFNPHPENEKLMPLLDKIETLYPEEGRSSVPNGLGFKATVLWFYYKDMEGIQNFYENILGFDLNVDQGWAKIYPISQTGFFGPVDETRGMHHYTDKKAVTLSIITDNIEGWHGYMSRHPDIEMRSEEIRDSEWYRSFVAYDPEAYYLEWNVFKDVLENKTLNEAVRK